MKILIVSQYFWPEHFRINEVAKSLFEKGHDVEVLTGKPNYPKGVKFEQYKFWGCRQEIHQGLKINRVPMLARGNGAVRLALNYLSFVISGLVFGPWMLRKKKIDVIFIYAPSPILQAIPAIFLGWLHKCPVVLWIQDLWPESLSATGYIKNGRLLKLIGYVVRCIYNNSDLLLVQSRAFVPAIVSMAPCKRIIYFPNSVDDVFTKNVDVRLPEIRELEAGFCVLFAGNVGSVQAVDTILEASILLQDHPDIRFIVLGQGSRLAWMRQQIQLKKLTNLYLPGQFPVETMPGLMKKAEVLLVTLIDKPIFAATIPNKIQAYMAIGKPILASINGEGARLVREANAGLAVPAEDARAMADAILKFSKMTKDERTCLGLNGQRYFTAHFNHDDLMNQLIEHFRTITKLDN